MTPKQKKQRQESLEMLKFLGFTKDFSGYSYTHMRKIIEARKLKVLTTLGIDVSHGFTET